MTRHLPLRPLAAGLSGFTLLFASGVSAEDRLGPINITAAREAPAVAPAMPQTVITREEIERSQADSLPELLAGRAGLVVSNEGGPGKLSSVSIWGQNANRTAVFVDGTRIGSVSAGQSYLEHIPLAHVERIEIVRGPRSGQWGADAGGGVIQIFTREGARDGVQLSGGVGAGSRGQREADAQIAGRRGSFDYSLGVAHQETDGFDACDNGDPFAPPFCGNEPDDDGYELDSAQVQAGYRFGDGGHLRAQALVASAEVEYDGARSNNSEIEQRTIGLSASTGRVGLLQLRARLGRHLDYQDSYADGNFAHRFDTRRDTFSLAGDVFLGDRTTLSLGTDQTRDELSSSTDFEETERDNHAIFGQLNSRLGDLELQLALRRDFNEQFGTANTGSLDLAYRLDERWTLSAGHGTSFNVPSFNLLYYPFGYGNPDLEPERTRTSRAGIAWANGPWAVEARAFRSTGDDLIDSPPPTYVPENVDKATIRGAEVEARWTTEIWSARTSLTYLSTENEATGDSLTKQPRWNGRLSLDRQLGAFSAGTTLHGRSGSEGGQRGYVVADLRGAYRINADWRLEARIENLFDRDHQPVHGYHAAPRGLFVGLRYGR